MTAELFFVSCTLNVSFVERMNIPNAGKKNKKRTVQHVQNDPASRNSLRVKTRIMQSADVP